MENPDFHFFILLSPTTLPLKKAHSNKKRGPQPSFLPVCDPLQALLVLGQHAHQSAVASCPIPVASVQAENIVGVAEVVDADVAVVPGFEVLLRLFADHGVWPPVVSFAVCWAHISSAKGMSGTSKRTEEEM